MNKRDLSIELTIFMLLENLKRNLEEKETEFYKDITFDDKKGIIITENNKKYLVTAVEIDENK